MHQLEKEEIAMFIEQQTTKHLKEENELAELTEKQQLKIQSEEM